MKASSKPSGSRDLYSAIEKALKGSPIAGLFPPLPQWFPLIVALVASGYERFVASVKQVSLSSLTS
ncbi:hypothetical protein HID58_084600 [Brassica napus]|uniref:Uncharacterized protein n=1 Tax=Brassica napus TaxID=3708 RepID=A0ABQ7XK63_BRANA|nr:hypothetical protein HID58_084600 [Brassica napus]